MVVVVHEHGVLVAPSDVSRRASPQTAAAEPSRMGRHYGLVSLPTCAIWRQCGGRRQLHKWPMGARAAARATDLAGRLDPTAIPFSARTGKRLSSGRLVEAGRSARAGGQSAVLTAVPRARLIHKRDRTLEPG
jgi:hypothetical protein